MISIKFCLFTDSSDTFDPKVSVEPLLLPKRLEELPRLPKMEPLPPRLPKREPPAALLLLRLPKRDPPVLRLPKSEFPEVRPGKRDSVFFSSLGSSLDSSILLLNIFFCDFLKNFFYGHLLTCSFSSGISSGALLTVKKRRGRM